MDRDQKTLGALAETMTNASLVGGRVDRDHLRAWLCSAQQHEKNASPEFLLIWALQLSELLEMGSTQALLARDSVHVASYLRAITGKPADVLVLNTVPQDAHSLGQASPSDAPSKMGWETRPLYKETRFIFKILNYPYAEHVLLDLFAQPDWSPNATVGLLWKCDMLVHKRTLPFQRFSDTAQGLFLACATSAMVKSVWKPAPEEAGMYRQAWYFAGEPYDLPGSDGRNVQRIGILLEHLPDCGQEMLTFFLLHPKMNRSALEPMFPLPVATLGSKAQLQQLVHMHMHRDRIACWGSVAELFEQHHPHLSQFLAAHLAVHVEGQDLGYVEDTWARLVANGPLVSEPTFSVEGLVMDGTHDQ